MANNWLEGTVPLVDEDVVIEAGWKMIFDIENSPIFNTITINGKLIVKNL